jgi:hypothetical protein
MKMKTFEVSVVITVKAEDAISATEEGRGAFDYMYVRCHQRRRGNPDRIQRAGRR